MCRLASGRGRRGGFAILMVVLVLVGLLIIGAPFALTMRQQETASLNFAARIQAKLVALGALNLAKAQLERSHEFYEQYEADKKVLGTIFNSPYVDSTGELRVDLADGSLPEINLANPTGAMWSASAQDEQGKLNLKSVSKAALTNLLLTLLGETLDPANPGATRSAQIADAIVAYRTTHPFTSFTQLREAVTNITESEYQRLVRFLTLYSAPLAGDTAFGAPTLHPVNVNTCPEEILRALLLGIKLYEPGKAEADRHKGVGLDTYTAKDKDGNDVTWTDDFNELIRRLRVFARLGADVETSSTEVILSFVQPSDDRFPIPKLGEPPTEPVEGFWISIEGDAVRYWKKEGSTLAIWYKSDDPSHPAAARVDRPRKYDADVPVEVRLLLTDIEHDLAGILQRLVDEKKLTPRSRSAILANVINPLNPQLDLTTTTVPVCCRSFDIYSIEATGIVNTPDGRERARYSLREVAQVAPQVDLEVRIETQEDFERSRQAGMSWRVATWPNAAQVSDVAPKSTEPPELSLIPRHGRLGLEPFAQIPKASSRFALRFDGPLFDDVLRGDPAPFPDPVNGLTTVKPEGGDDSDLLRDGLHVGEVPGVTKPRTLAYRARVDDPPKDADGNPINQDNIPFDRSWGDVRPFILSMWVKLDPRGQFDYARDHFLFDLGHEGYSNRLALYYDSTSGSGGDLVLRVCDSTIQGTAAEVRHPITEATFQPERWYHLQAVVKGIHHNELALLIDGKSVGRYYPCASLSGAVDNAVLSFPCSNLTGNEDGGNPKIFKPFLWPQSGGAILGAEIVQYASAAGSLTIPDGGRGARGSQARAHATATRVELFGYDTHITSQDYHTYQPLPYLVKPAEQPALEYSLPEAFADVTVDDGDEKDYPGGVTPTPVTPDATDDYWSKWNTSYQTASTVHADYTIPAEGWIPVGASEKWLIKPVVEEGDPPDIERALRDREEFFKQVVDYTKPQAGLLRLVCWTTQQLSVAGNRAITEADGLGFFRLLKNPDAISEEAKQEIAKFKKAGVVLVWRYHPADGGKPDAEKRMFAWYIGYVADFAQRRCFGTGEEGTGGGGEAKPIVETAVIRLDCIKISNNRPLARGYRGTVTTTHTVPGTDPPISMTQTDTYAGHGIFEVRGTTASGGTAFEWFRFTYPRFVPSAKGQPELKTEEEELCGYKFVVGVLRAQQGKSSLGDAKAYAFTAPAAVMPVFFVASNRFSIGPADDVTLTDATGQRETKQIFHVLEPPNYDWSRFTFVALPQSTFAYARNPRLLKFPSGTLPIAPDTCFYLGSDTTCYDGDAEQPYTEGGQDRREDPTNPEPERPANATFADIRVIETSNNAARLWDFKKTGGPPDDVKNPRWAGFAPGTDAPPIAADLAPPFYVRLGYLERITPKGSGDPLPFIEPYRFWGHVGWPTEGYLKINDECMYYRKVYYNRTGGHGATMLLPSGSPPKDADGFVIALQKTDATVYVNGDEAKDFPAQGYITISNSIPSKDYWSQFAAIAGADPARQKALLDWLNQGNPLIGPNGQPMGRYGSTSGEYMFYSSREDTTVRGQKAVKLNVAYRACLNSTAQEVRLVDPSDPPPNWYLSGYSDNGSASVSVVGVEFMILERGCLGTAPSAHPVGSVMMPLDHIPASLAPRPMVKLKRDKNGLLIRNTDGKMKADEWPDFDITKPEFEYGIVLEDNAGFPGEGYVQIGNEILGYSQENAQGGGLWEAKVPDAADPTGYRTVKALTGIKLLRKRYGTALETYLTPGDPKVIASVNPDDTVPQYYGQPADFVSPQQHRRIVRLVEPRFHDRYPSLSGQFTPHATDTRIGYYEFALNLPGALWTRVKWKEAKYDTATGAIVNTSPLDDRDPWDIEVMAQVDNAPAWDDTASDPLPTDPKNLVATPVHWLRDFPNRTDAYDPRAYCFRPKKPVIYFFDNPAEDNWINTRGGAPRGQRGDRIRLRVYFRFKDYDPASDAPNYSIPWRTPWVDTITIRYQAPTQVMEHREMPY